MARVIAVGPDGQARQVADDSTTAVVPMRVGEHLHPGVRAMLARPDADRLDFLRQDRFVAYPRARASRATFEAVYRQNAGHRLRGLLLHGPPNNGKSAIARRFVREHPQHATASAARFPALQLGLPPRPDPRRFYTALLARLHPTSRGTGLLSQLERQVIALMQAYGVRLLVLDDLDNLAVGRDREIAEFANTLRFLADEVPLVLALVGGEEGAGLLDESLAARLVPCPLPAWAAGAELARLLDIFESLLPLRRPSHLSGTLAGGIIAQSGGRLGRIVDLLRRAAAIAIESGRERIDRKALAAAETIPRGRTSTYDDGGGWLISPAPGREGDQRGRSGGANRANGGSGRTPFSTLVRL